MSLTWTRGGVTPTLLTLTFLAWNLPPTSARAEEVRRVAGPGDPDPSDPTRTLDALRRVLIGQGGSILVSGRSAGAPGDWRDAVYLEEVPGDLETIAREGAERAWGGTFVQPEGQGLGGSAAVVTDLTVEGGGWTVGVRNGDGTLRRVITIGDLLDRGRFDGIADGPLVNELGHVLIKDFDGDLVFVDATGEARAALVIGDTIPGGDEEHVDTIDAIFLSDNGKLTAQINYGTWIVQGAPGALQWYAARGLFGDEVAQTYLAGVSPSGEAAVIGDARLKIGPLRALVEVPLPKVIADYTITQWVDFGTYAYGSLLADGKTFAATVAATRDGCPGCAAVVVYHDGTWSLVAATDQPMPGGESIVPQLVDLNEQGQVIFAHTFSELGTWRYDKAATSRLTAIAVVGDSLPMGDDGLQVARTIRVERSFGAGWPRAFNDEGDVVFLAEYDAVGAVNTWAAFVTQPPRPLELPDLVVEAFVRNDAEGEPRDWIRVTNQGRGIAPTLTFEMEVRGGFLGVTFATESDGLHDCEARAATVVCDEVDGLGPGESVELRLPAYFVTFLTGAPNQRISEVAVTVRPTGVDDADPSDNTVVIPESIVPDGSDPDPDPDPDPAPDTGPPGAKSPLGCEGGDGTPGLLLLAGTALAARVPTRRSGPVNRRKGRAAVPWP